MQFLVTFGLLVFALTAPTSTTSGQDEPAAKATEGAVEAPGGESSAMPLPLKVVGTRLLNSRNEPVRLRGVNTAGLEWSSNGEGRILVTVKTAIEDWHVDHIRLPLAQDRWFGKAPEQKDDGAGYRMLVKQVVDLCAGHGVYVIVDLHWSDAGEWGKSIGQHVMPDQNSVTFWKDVAQTYKNHPAVLFDLYNEPHHVSWDVWLKGGKVTEKTSKKNPETTYEAVGMQTLLDTVRATGARNVVIAGGLDWAYDMSGFLDGKQLSDPEGNGAIYANHAYPFKGDSVARWVAKMEKAAKTLPVIVSEFGGGAGGKPAPADGDPWVRQVLQALHDHDWSWTAWDLHPKAGPTLISDWNYTPTPEFGVWVKHALLGTLEPYARPQNSSPQAEGSNRDRPAALGIFESEADVGTVLHPGAVTFDPTARSYTVSAGGENMWDSQDAFHYVWTKASGDLSLTADIAFIGAGKAPHRKACLVIRQSLDPDSAYVDAALHGNGLTSLQFREEKGAETHEIQANVSAPRRLRIEKRGKYVSMFLAPGGNELAFSGAAERIAFQEPFFVGIGVCAHDKEVMEKAVFSNVELNTTLRAPSTTPVFYSTLEIQTIAVTDRRVVFVSPTRIEAPTWLRDGASLIFSGGGRLLRIPTSGGQPRAIDTGFATRCGTTHGVSPDGRLLAISDKSQGNGQSLIYTLPVTGGTPKLITKTGPSYWHGWSPDGKTLAFCGERNGEFDVYTIPADGGTETRLTTAQGLDDGPDYDPTGEFIYFNSERSGRMQIWRMRPDGSDQEQVTDDHFNNWFPHPSPDGRHLVFLSYDKSISGHPDDKDVTLRRMVLEGKKIDVLGRFLGGRGTIDVPCWSPDGRRIAFVTYQLVP